MSESNLSGDAVAAASFELDEEILLLLESSGRLMLLNSTASSVWRGLESGLTPLQICRELSERTRTPLERVTHDYRQLVSSWRELGALTTSGSSTIDGVAHHEVAHSDASPCRSLDDAPGPVPELDSASVTSFRLLDLGFRIRTRNAEDARLVHDLISHLRTSDSVAVTNTFDLVRLQDRYALQRNGRIVDTCSSDRDEMIPMIHANVLLAAYQATDCMAALHSAAVTRNGECVLMPGISGAGKSTLTAALLSEGFGYCTDDLVILTHAPVRIRTLDLKIGLKDGAWGVLRNRWPQLEGLPVYRRADGRRIRYFLPETPLQTARHRPHLTATSIVFPSYAPGSELEVRSIRSGDAFLRLTNAGYDLPHRIDARVVASLVDWLSEIPCFSLRYGDLDQAVDAMLTITR